MDIFALGQLLSQRAESGCAYLEFFRRPSLSLGVYHLRAGETDKQQPHTEDEIYYVIAGHATIRVGTEDRPIGPGSIVFVVAEADHKFHSITEDLLLLVLFAPAEGTAIR
jgi:mannose-6-phosphate isomerase-like protein (cupin superfamily)